jgi:integrase
MAYTGMRRVEISRLTWADVNFAGNTIRILGKGGKLRNIPIHPALGEVLIGSPPVPGQAVLRGRGGKPLSVTSLDRMMRELSSTARMHDFRRTVASSLYANGVRSDTIDRILGWAPREVRSRYYVKIADEELQSAILQLHLNDPISS